MSVHFGSTSGIVPMQTNNQAAKASSTFRATISGLWALYMEAIEHHEWSRANHIKAGIEHLEAAEIKEVEYVTLPC